MSQEVVALPKGNPLIIKDMDSNGKATGQDTERLQEAYAQRFEVPWKVVQKAIDHGDIVPGWVLIDYIRATEYGSNVLGLMCGCGHIFYDYDVFDEHIAKTGHKPNLRKPFENVNIWGPNGASKSNFLYRLMAMFYQKWPLALKYMLLTKEMLSEAYEDVPDPNQRIPMAGLDDLNSIISKQEWFQDKEFYIKFHKFLNTIRTKIGTVGTTLPNIEFTPEMLGDVVSFEVTIYRNSTYAVNRYCWDYDPIFPLKARFIKVVVEAPMKPYNIYDIPREWWDSYQEKRKGIANDLFLDMKNYMVNGGKDKEEKKKTARLAARGAYTTDNLADAMRELGIKAPQAKILELNKRLKAIGEKKALSEL